MPDITILIVSDYQSSGQRSWNDERECLQSLAALDLDQPVEYLLCEDSRFEGEVPEDLFAILPGMRTLFVQNADSYTLKNAGARAATTPLLALVDADCRPTANWLRVAVETLRKRPEVAGISGRTVYPGTDRAERILALLSRAYLDPGRTGPTGFLSNNCAVVRREVFVKYPLPEKLGAFSSRIQSEEMLRAGGVLWFDGRVRVVHEFEGWPMETDIRRHLGWSTVATRLEVPNLPYAGLVRIGPMAIPAIWAGKLWNCWMDCLRCATGYGVKWYEVPLALSLACVLVTMEVPGMWKAYQRRTITETAYR